MKRLLSLVLLLLSPPAFAADLALVGGKVFVVSGPPIEGGTVLIRGDRIVAVGKDVALPAGATVMRCEGKWITPGLIESRTQLGLVEVSGAPETNDAAPNIPDIIRAAARMDDAVNMRSLLIDVARRHGVTSALASPSGGLISGRSAWIDLIEYGRPGWKTAVQGPVAMHAVFGEIGAAVSGHSRAMALMRLREVLDDARLYKRDEAAFRKNALRKMAASRLDLEALQPVLDRRMKLVIEAHRAADLSKLIEFARTERIDVVLVGAEEGWIVAEELAAAKVPVVLNAMSNLPARFDSLETRADNAALLARAGVKVVLTTESSHLASNLRFVLGNAVRAGLPWDLALRAGTLSAAEAVGQERRYGSLEAGKAANIVVWTGDPFEPASFAETVLIRGERQPTESRQTRLRDRYKARLKL